LALETGLAIQRSAPKLPCNFGHAEIFNFEHTMLCHGGMYRRGDTQSFFEYATVAYPTGVLGAF